MLLCIGMPVPDAKLKDVTITPQNGRYACCFKFGVSRELPEVKGTAQRICAIDFGVDNLMAVTNRRNDQVDDCIRKYAKHFITWCVENRIDTVVVGVNRFWKQESNIGHKSNQEFVQIPFAKLKDTIRYLCEWNGIRCVEQEESYTSKASFLDMDPIPVYGEEDPLGAPLFSGRRRPYWHHGEHKKDGFRGLYVSADGTVINSDLNGSANILRKAFPDAFLSGLMPDFTDTAVIRHPDPGLREVNHDKQLAANTGTSRARQKRERRKQSLRLPAV